MNPFGDTPFDGNNEQDAPFMNTIILYAIVANLNDVHYRLTLIKRTLQQHPDVFTPENAFELNATITEFLEKMIEVRKSEVRKILDKDPTLRVELERMGINPDDFN